MKNILILAALGLLVSCGDKKTDQPVTKKVICGDSVEQELFDESGNSYIVRIPGQCDTIEVQEEKD